MKKFGISGDPESTVYYEFYNLMKIIKPKKNDVYYDLGCGYGNTCRWISKKIKLAIGIEDTQSRYNEALRRTPKSKYPNVKIINCDFSNFSYGDASIIYSTSTTFNDFVKFKKKLKKGTRIIVPTEPPYYPIKSKKFGDFFICVMPFEKVKDENEYTQIFMGNKKSEIKDMFKYIGRKKTKSLKWYISRGKSNWKKLKSKNQ